MVNKDKRVVSKSLYTVGWDYWSIYGREGGSCCIWIRLTWLEEKQTALAKKSQALWPAIIVGNQKPEWD